MSAGDKKRQLVITEVRPSGSGTFTELNTRFTWDAASQTSHRGSWEYELGLRTVREDYAGTNRPTEQVLGWNWKPFTMSGWWDNRWAAEAKKDDNYAENTRVAFEDMVKRGNLSRIEFESLSVIGLITNLKITYRTQYRIGWEFTVSPHQHATDDSLTFAPTVVKRNPKAHSDVNQALVNKMIALMLAAPKTIMTGTLFTDVQTQVNLVLAAMATVDNVIQNRVLLVAAPRVDAPVDSVARLAGAFSGLGAAALAIPPLVANCPLATSLAFIPGTGSLAFQVWTREMAFQARAVFLAAYQAQQDLLSQAAPDALALYRPYAGESLYAISNRFFNTPHRWRDIAARNNLHVLVLDGTEHLVIPAGNS